MESDGVTTEQLDEWSLHVALHSLIQIQYQTKTDGYTA